MNQRRSTNTELWEYRSCMKRHGNVVSPTGIFQIPVCHRGGTGGLNNDALTDCPPAQFDAIADSKNSHEAVFLAFNRLFRHV